MRNIINLNIQKTLPFHDKFVKPVIIDPSPKKVLNFENGELFLDNITEENIDLLDGKDFEFIIEGDFFDE